MEKIAIFFPKKGQGGGQGPFGNFPEIHPFSYAQASLSGDVTDAGRTDVRTDGRTREDRANQPMEAGWLSFAIELTG